MDIGTAKISPEEMQGVPHHLIDILEPDTAFNVTMFQKLAREALQGIYERGKIPVVVGGTGFYIQALLYDIDFSEETGDMSVRKPLKGWLLNGAPNIFTKPLPKWIRNQRNRFMPTM